MTADPGVAEPTSHRALIYASTEEFVEAAIPFVSGGLARGEPVLVVTAASNLGPLRDAMGPDAVRAHLVDSFDWPRTAPRARTAFVHWCERHHTPGRSVRLLGEPMWEALSGLQMREWTYHDAAINASLRHAPVPTQAACAYDARVAPRNVIEDAERAHPELLRGAGRPLPNETFEDPNTFLARRRAEPLPDPPATATVLPFDADLRAVRRFVEDHGRDRGLSEQHLSELVTAVNEVATNVREHGGGSGVVRSWFDPGELVCEVQDPYGRFTDAWPGVCPPASTEEGGRGLWLARQLCDAVEVRSSWQGTSVRLHSYIG